MKKIATLVAVAGLASIASAQTFTGSTFTPPDSNPAGASGTALASGLTNPIQSVSVNIIMSHTWVGDLVATLTSPGGTTFTLFSRAGSTTLTGVGSSANLVVGTGYNFTDTATTNFWPGVGGWGSTTSATNLPNGNYRTTASLTGAATSLDAAFGGQDGNGTWTLFMSDNAGGDIPSAVDWSVTITQVPTPGAAALLGLAGLVAARRRRA